MKQTILFFLAMMSALTSFAELPPLIPLRDFFRNPDQTGFKLSPDGKHLSYLSPWENRLNIWIRTPDQEDATRITASTERDIRSYFWANNEQLLYLMDQGGDENDQLWLVDITGGDPRNLTPFEGVKVSIIDDLEDQEDFLIIGMNRRNPQVFDPYRIQLSTGELELLAENPGNITGWMTDHDGKLRVASVTDGVNTSLLYRETEDQEFQTVLTTNFRETLSPVLFTFDNQLLYAKSNIGRDKEALVIIEPSTASEKEVIFSHPKVDVGNLIYSRERQKITGISYVYDITEFHFFDEVRENIQMDLEKQLPSVEVRIASSSKDEKTMLIRTFSDRSLGSYYIYQVDSKELTHLVDVAPWLPKEHLAEMKPIEFTSRDGLTLQGYLTLPKGIPAENLPLVLNPHGGPWARDYWTFNPYVQFLANRGYAVLQVNFRGSTGFGREFWEKSFKQWGKTMQDDLTDGVQWLIEQGIVDAEKVAIYGGSYGGYAALAGLTFTPDVYACGVSFVGPSSLFTLMESFPTYWEPFRDMFYEMVGDPVEEEELVRAASPLFHIDQIKAPLLIIQGANDPRVKKAESDQIVKALREKGIDVPYMVKDNEGHGFGNEENRIHMVQALEAFLAQHIGGRHETSLDILEPLFATEVP